MMEQIQEKLCNKRKYERPKQEQLHLPSPSETSNESEIATENRLCTGVFVWILWNFQKHIFYKLNVNGLLHMGQSIQE